MKLTLQVTLTLYRMLFFVLYLIANIVVFYAISELTWIYIIPLSVLILFVYACSLDTLTFVNKILKILDDNILEVYQCREDVVMDGLEDYIVFSYMKTYIPLEVYPNGILFADDLGRKHVVPYSFLDKYFNKLLIKVEDMRKFKCKKDLLSSEGTIYFREGSIYREIGYNYGGIILLDETGNHHTLSDKFWPLHMEEIDDTALDFDIK